MIATGGGPGLMEAANRGAADVGAPSIGFNITLPREQEPNAYSTPELTFRFHYFAMRKMHLAMRANALVVLPGGFGTFDELFEILNLRITGKAPPLPIVLLDRAYWESVVNFDALDRKRHDHRAEARHHPICRKRRRDLEKLSGGRHADTPAQSVETFLPTA